MTEFGKLTPEGYTKLGTLDRASMMACPFYIMDFTHYRENGSCKCNDPTEQERMKREWGYIDSDFAK